MASAPSASLRKQDGVTGAVQPGSAGVMAYVATAAASSLAANVAASFASQSLALAAVGNGPLVEYCSYNLDNSGNEVVAVVPTTGTAATYGTVVHTGVAGTMVPTAGGTSPLDDYQVIVTFPGAGTIGTTGITYTYSLDGGINTVGPLQLGTANSITLNLPSSAGGGSSGVSFALGAGTVIAGDTFTCSVKHARMTNSDVTAALEALRVTKLPFEGIFVDEEYATGLISLLDTWLAAREAEGRFYFFVVNTRSKNLPVPTAESESAYLTAMTTLVGSDTSIRGVVGTDGAQLTSPVTGLFLYRPTGMYIMTRAASVSIGEDMAFVGRGPLAGSPSLADSSGNPKWHDESLYPGLEAIRLSPLRTFSTEQGVYISDALVFSSGTSDYQFLQHIRCMNAACTVAFAALVKQLSVEIGTKPPDPVTGAVYISEASARQIESAVNDALTGSGSELTGQVQGAQFTLSRTDNLASNAGAFLSGDVAVNAFRYVKKISAVAHFVRSLPTARPAPAAA